MKCVGSSALVARVCRAGPLSRGEGGAESDNAATWRPPRTRKRCLCIASLAYKTRARGVPIVRGFFDSVTTGCSMSRSSSSFAPPFTASGRSALVQAPPWHYAGWLVNVGFSFDAAHGAALVPPEVGVATGHGCVHFADWQSCGDDGREMLDPVYAQYRETIVVLEMNRRAATHRAAASTARSSTSTRTSRCCAAGCRAGPRRSARPGSRAACR